MRHRGPTGPTSPAALQPLAILLALALAGCATVARPVGPAGDLRPAWTAPAGAPAPSAGGPAPGGAVRPMPPRPPAGLVAFSGEPREVPLRWQPVLRGAVTGYRVYRRDPNEGEFVEVARLAGAVQTSFVDRGGAPADRPGRLGDGRTYLYAVAAEGPGGVGERSEPVAATTALPPAPPLGLDAAPPRADEILLTWEPSRDPGVAGYRLFRSPYAAGPFEPVGEVRGRFATAFADPASSGLLRLRTYYYRVAALGVAGSEGPPSEPVPAWLKPPPFPPLDLAATGLARHVRLRWSAGHEPDLRETVVWRALGDGPFVRLARLPAGRTEYTDAGLADGTTYRYRLSVIDADRLESAPSAVVSVTTRARPEPPAGVVAVRAGDGVEVRWRAAPGAGIVRYRVVRVGFLGRLEPVAEVAGTAARDVGAAGGRYAVVAIDADGLESPPSRPVAVREAPAASAAAVPSR